MNYAEVSSCGTWRYRLERDGVPPDLFVPRIPALAFVMLNPSTADATEDDPTIRRCVLFALREMATRLVVGNLFAWRSPSPADLVGRGFRVIVGPANDAALRRIMSAGHPIVLGWGTHRPPLLPLVAMREEVLRGMALEFRPPLFCLGTCEGGAPRHPLYVRAAQPLVPWDADAWRAR